MRVIITTLVLAATTQMLAAQASRDILLTTTTSVRDAGLLDAILPAFERSSGYSVLVVAVGTGQALELGRRGEADLLIVHAPELERRFIEEGYGTHRRPLMENAFVLVGPPEDVARIDGLNVREALRAIARACATFVSRGDRSGTHVKELSLWDSAGTRPDPSWYRETGQGMGATLVIADQLGGYVLTDTATLLAHRAPLHLTTLVAGDAALRNPYHVISIAPDRFPRVNHEGARALTEFLLSSETQRAIAVFGVEQVGRALFVPSAR